MVPDPFPVPYAAIGDKEQRHVADSYHAPYESAPYHGAAEQQQQQQAMWVQQGEAVDRKQQQEYGTEEWDKEYAVADGQAAHPAPNKFAHGMEVDGEVQPEQDSTTNSTDGSEDDNPTAQPTNNPSNDNTGTKKAAEAMEHELEGELKDQGGDQKLDLDVLGGFLGDSDIPIIQAHIPLGKLL